MALNPPDMDICTPKALCLSGPNEGLAYDPSDPCSDFPSTNFDPLKCDCVSVLPTNEVQWRITSGNVAAYGTGLCGGNYSCSVPSQWGTIVGAPYYNGSGALVQTTVCPMITWGCNFNALQCEFCDLNSLSPFPSTVTVTKTDTCGGGSAILLYGGFQTYEDGVLVNSQQGAIGYVRTTDNKSFCDSFYPVGYTWTANFEYRTSDGQGGWLPGIQ